MLNPEKKQRRLAVNRWIVNRVAMGALSLELADRHLDTLDGGSVAPVTLASDFIQGP